MKKLTRTMAIIIATLFMTNIKGQAIIPENSEDTPWTDSSALLIQKFGLNNIWDYSKILNIPKDDSLWFKPYEPIIFNTQFIADLVGDINTRPMNDSIVISFPDSTLTTFGTTYLQKRRITVLWDAEGSFSGTNIIQRKIVSTDRVQTIRQDSNATCINFTNKLTYFKQRDTNLYSIAFVQAFMETCDHIVSNYYKRLFVYDPNFNYQNSDLSSIINLQVDPNPSSGNGVSKVSYYIPTSGDVLIELQNAVTLQSQVIFSGNKLAGDHFNNVIVNNIIPGTYYVKLTYQNQTFSRIFIIN